MSCERFGTSLKIEGLNGRKRGSWSDPGLSFWILDLWRIRTMRVFSLMGKLMVAGALLLAPVVSFAGIFISVGVAPPALPVYTQPLCPGDGYLWTPGYWHYGPAGYYWVPGVWVRPPQVGYLWTPGYWGWGGSAFIFHEGYWGPHIGFYGGVNYGFGYGGAGDEGGYWNHRALAHHPAGENSKAAHSHNRSKQNGILHNAYGKPGAADGG